MRAAGPERIGPEWWAGAGGQDEAVRDYYRIEDADGRRYWLYRAGLYGRWRWRCRRRARAPLVRARALWLARAAWHSRPACGGTSRRHRRTQTPPPHPGPLLPSFLFPQAPGARSARLALAPCGARGEKRENRRRRLRSPSALPGRQARTARLRRALARRQANGVSARRLREMNKLGGGTGGGGRRSVRASACASARYG